MSKEKTLMGQYMDSIEPHGRRGPSFLDTDLRMCIGKTDDVYVAKCSHNAILERERDADGKDPEHYCRACGIYLNVDGIGRCNDFLVLRHLKCRGPICLNCIARGGDVFHTAFSKGLEKYEVFKAGVRDLGKAEELLDKMIA